MPQRRVSADALHRAIEHASARAPGAAAAAAAPAAPRWEQPWAEIVARALELVPGGAKPLLDDETMPLRGEGADEGSRWVLGHLLDPDVVPLFRAAKEKFAAGKGRVAGAAALISNCPEGVLGRRLKASLSGALEAAMGSAFAGGGAISVEAALAALPADLPVASRFERGTVGADDPRVGLRGASRGEVGFPSHPTIPAGTFIGFYRGRVVRPDAFDGMRHAAPVGCPFTVHALLVEAYACDITTADGDVVTGGALVHSGYEFGNLTSMVNDARIDPLRDPGGKVVAAPNVTLREVRIGGWPFMVMHTTRDLNGHHKELLLDYGPGYWLKMRGALRSVRAQLTAAGLWERDASDEALALAAARALDFVGALAAWQRNPRGAGSIDTHSMHLVSRILSARNALSGPCTEIERMEECAEREAKRARVE